MSRSEPSYLLSGQASELERLTLQSRVWEPAGRDLLNEIHAGSAPRAIDIGCGALGWLRILSEWAGRNGEVTGSDIDDRLLAAARSFIEDEGLRNVTVVRDDLFDSRLEAATFDLVHSRFQIAPLGRGPEQMAVYLRLAKPGGWLVVEDPDIASWHVNPDAPGVNRLIALIEEGFRAAGGCFSSGRELPALFRSLGLKPEVRARVVALGPGHPYLRLPIQFANALRPRLDALAGQQAVEETMRLADAELNNPECWGTTFTLIQSYAQVP